MSSRDGPTWVQNAHHCKKKPESTFMSFPHGSFYFLHKYAVINTPWATELRKMGHEGGVNPICLLEEDKELLLMQLETRPR